MLASTPTRAEQPTVLSLLLVEDDPLIADLLLLVLEEAGFLPTWRASADEAISLLDAGDAPHAIITDIFLGPGQPPGWAVARHARLRDPEIPVVFITGDSGHQWHAEGVPGSEIFTKPFDHERMIETLKRMLTERSSGRH